MCLHKIEEQRFVAVEHRAERVVAWPARGRRRAPQMTASPVKVTTRFTGSVNGARVKYSIGVVSASAAIGNRAQ